MKARLMLLIWGFLIGLVSNMSFASSNSSKPDTNKMRTVCVWCAHLKTKCPKIEGSTSCSRCIKRGQDCVFEFQKKRGPEVGFKTNSKKQKTEDNNESQALEHHDCIGLRALAAAALAIEAMQTGQPMSINEKNYLPELIPNSTLSSPRHAPTNPSSLSPLELNAE